jgi:hypothetical protein
MVGMVRKGKWVGKYVMGKNAVEESAVNTIVMFNNLILLTESQFGHDSPQLLPQTTEDSQQILTL